jgi:hypothetical protein
MSRKRTHGGTWRQVWPVSWSRRWLRGRGGDRHARRSGEYASGEHRDRGGCGRWGEGGHPGDGCADRITVGIDGGGLLRVGRVAARGGGDAAGGWPVCGRHPRGGGVPTATVGPAAGMTPSTPSRCARLLTGVLGEGCVCGWVSEWPRLRRAAAEDRGGAVLLPAPLAPHHPAYSWTGHRRRNRGRTRLVAPPRWARHAGDLPANPSRAPLATPPTRPVARGPLCPGTSGGRDHHHEPERAS